MKAAEFFTEDEQAQILEAIKTAESDTSGEIRVHLESLCNCDVLERASEMFSKLAMHKTELRNGVLFYLALDDHKFAIIGDAGINKVVPSDFWDNIKDVMHMSFVEGKFTEGLVKGIQMAGEKLKTHFPFKKDDVNELSDEISFGKN